MHAPCEIVVRKLLPAFRLMIAQELVNKYGLTQEEAAKTIGVKQAAISFYIHSKRGKAYASNYGFIKPFAIEAARKIIKEKATHLTILNMFCSLCKELRRNRKLCDPHRESLELPYECDACL